MRIRLHLLVEDIAVLSEGINELIAVTTEQGYPGWGALETISRGWVKVKNGDIATGLSLLRSSLAASHANRLWMPQNIFLLAGACEIAGQVGEAVTLLDEALQMVESTGERWLEAELNRHKGELLLRQGHSEAVE